LFVILAIVMSFALVQGVSAEIVSSAYMVSGSINSISTNSMIVVDGTEVYGMRIKWLEKQYDIVLQEDPAMTVSIDGYYAICEDGSTKFVACEITVVETGGTAELRNCPE
jgi:hypothetical protein